MYVGQRVLHPYLFSFLIFINMISQVSVGCPQQKSMLPNLQLSVIMKQRSPKVETMHAFSRSHSFTKVAFLLLSLFFCPVCWKWIWQCWEGFDLQKITCFGEQLSNKMEGTRAIDDIKHSNFPVVDARLPISVRWRTFLFLSWWVLVFRA